MKNYKFILIIFLLFFNFTLQAQSIEKKNKGNEESIIKEIEEQWLKELNKKQVQKKESESDNLLSDKDKATVFGESPSLFSLIVRFVITLAFFVVIFYYVFRFLKKKNLILNQENSPIKILATIPLMSGKFLQIIDVAGQIIILGISENNISLIQIVEKSTVAEQIRFWVENQKTINQRGKSLWNEIYRKLFGDKFKLWHQDVGKNQRDFFEELSNQKNDTIKVDDLSELLRLQKEKLKKIKET